jgi:hypothetical protein
MAHNEQETNAIAEQILIRSEMRWKLIWLLPQSFQDLYRALTTIEGIDHLLMMHAIASVNPNFGPDIQINIHKTALFNEQMLLSEIFDDWWACYLCFTHGFTKQAQAILRNTVELVVQWSGINWNANGTRSVPATLVLHLRVGDADDAAADAGSRVA